MTMTTPRTMSCTKGVDAVEHETVSDDRDREHAEQRADDGPASPRERRAADDHGRDDVELQSRGGASIACAAPAA
jgi:hypothetical protein